MPPRLQQGSQPRSSEQNTHRGRRRDQSQPGSTRFPGFAPTPSGIVPPSDSFLPPQAMSSASEAARQLSRRQQASQNRAGPTPAEVLGAYHVMQARRGGAPMSTVQQAHTARAPVIPQQGQGRGPLNQMLWAPKI